MRKIDGRTRRAKFLKAKAEFLKDVRTFFSWPLLKDFTESDVVNSWYGTAQYLRANRLGPNPYWQIQTQDTKDSA